MQVEKVYGPGNGCAASEYIRYTLSNEDLKEHDAVYPIARGRCLPGGGWILHEITFEDFITGFPDEPHTIINLNYSENKHEQVRTDHGFGPIESYYKIIKIEKRIEIISLPFSRLEWVEA